MARQGGSDVARLTVGQMAPDFTLVAGDGQRVTLSEARQNGPVVLAWYHLAFTGG